MRSKENRRLLAGLITVALSITEVLGYLPAYAANQEEEYSLENTVVSSWDGGYQGELLLRNLSDWEMTEWSIDFISYNSISDYWGASFQLVDPIDNEISEDYNQEYHYTIEAVDYTGTIAPEDVITIGYIASGTADDSVELSVNYVLVDPDMTEENPANTENNSSNDENADGQQNPEQTAEPAGGIYVGDGYTVEVQIPQTWDQAYNAKLLITNTTGETLHNWGFLLDTTDEISGLYNAMELSEHEGTRLFKNAGYNQDIPAGGTVEVGYTAFYEESPDVPDAFALASFEKSVEQTDYSVELFVTDEWEDGATAEIVIENTSDQAIEDWILEFDCDEQIEDIWGGVIEEYKNNHYIVRNAVYNHNIPVDSSVTIGIICGNSSFEISNPIIRMYSVQSDTSIVDDENRIQYMDTTPGEWTEDIGQVYFKDILSYDEVGLNVDGLCCVRNQLLITAYDNVAFSEMERIVTDVDARIVGYIELTDDYQIEMNEETDFETLELLRLQFESMPAVAMAEYNYVGEYSSELNTESDRYWVETGAAYELMDENYPVGKNWGQEAIYFQSALMTAGIIEMPLTANSVINTKDLTTVRIGAIDDVFYTQHPDLCVSFARVWNNYEKDSDFFDCDNSATTKVESDFHGTHVMGIEAAEFNSNWELAGICVKNRWYGFATKNIDSEINDCGIFEMKCGIALLVGNNVKVINYSLGLGAVCLAASSTLTDKNACDQKDCANKLLEKYSLIMDELILKLLDKGYDFLIVKAAGNANRELYYFSSDKQRDCGIGFIKVDEYNNEYKHKYIIDDTRTYGGVNSGANIICGEAYAEYDSPLSYSTNPVVKDHIICVGAASNYCSATRRDFRKSVFSNVGEGVEIWAPGENIWSTVPVYPGQDGYDKANGTSMAAPFVSGTAGLIWSIDPGLTSTEIKNIILESADIYNDILFLNVKTAVSQVVDRDSGITSFDERYYGLILGQVMRESVDGGSGALTDVNISALQIVDTNSNSIPEEKNGVRDVSITDEKGNYYLILTPGVYQITYFKNGYQAHTELVTIEAEGVTIQQNVVLNIEEQAVGTINLRIRDMDTREDICGATINVRQNWNQETGVLDNYEISGEYGFVTIQCEIGAYTVEVIKDGYIRGYYNVTSDSSNDRQYIYLKSAQNLSEYTLVFVSDADNIEERQTECHVYAEYYCDYEYDEYFYRHHYKIGEEGVEGCGTLDRPMVVAEQNEVDGIKYVTYKLNTYGLPKSSATTYTAWDTQAYFHLYSNIYTPNDEWDGYIMATPTVYVYNEDDLIDTIHLPKQGEGKIWDILVIDNGIYTSVNERIQAISFHR